MIAIGLLNICNVFGNLFFLITCLLTYFLTIERATRCIFDKGDMIYHAGEYTEGLYIVRLSIFLLTCLLTGLLTCLSTFCKFVY